MVEFKPSEVLLTGSFPPLGATMGRTEREIAASFVVWGCRHHGDRWKPLTLMELGAALGVALDQKVEPFDSMNRNPFCRPDLDDLVEAGFAAWAGAGVKRTIALNDRGLEALRRWVVREEVADG